MAKQQEMGFDPKAEEEARKNNDKLMKQLQKELEELRKAQGGKK